MTIGRGLARNVPSRSWEVMFAIPRVAESRVLIGGSSVAYSREARVAEIDLE